MSRSRLLQKATQHGAFAALLFAFLQAPTPALAQDGLLITITTSAGAFAQGIYNSSIRDNVIVDIDSVRTATIQNSVLGNVGIAQFNQDVGVGSNQSNMVMIALSAGATEPVALASFSGHVELTGNTVTVGNVTRTNVIENVLNGGVGIAQINQNSGNLNTNLNAVAIAIGIGPGTAAITIDEGTLSTTKTNNTFNITGPINQTNTISGITNFTGIAQISQTNGDGNIAANTMTIGITVVNIQ